MAAPFPLPDTISIFAPGGSPLATDLPARVVPMFDPKTWFVVNAGSPITRFGPTHWVDIESIYGWYGDPFVQVAAFKIAVDGNPSTIEVVTGNGILKLTLDYAELRYTNTEREYLRFYCTRLSFEVF